MKRNIKKVVILFVFIIFIIGNFTNAIVADEDDLEKIESFNENIEIESSYENLVQILVPVDVIEYLPDSDDGIYSVSLTATDDDGYNNSKEKTITVIEGAAWSVQLNFSEPGGSNTNVVFGEASNANDGGIPDVYDAMIPPAPPMPPYIRSWFDDGLPEPYNLLWNDYRRYPDTSKMWNLSVQWMPTSSVPTDVTITWDPSALGMSEYASVVLYDVSTNSVVADMLVDTQYIFTAPAYAPTSFQIKAEDGDVEPPSNHMGIISSKSAVAEGDEFNITVYIDPAEPVGGWQIYQLNFTQGKADATEVTPGSYWATSFNNGDIDNVMGIITDIQTWTMGPYPDMNHTACIINFTTLQPGLCTFEIVSVQITDPGFEDLNVTTHTATIIVTTPPIIYDEYPADLSTDVERPPVELSATVEDPDGDLMDVYIKWIRHDAGEEVTLQTYMDVSNGTYSFIPSGNDWIWRDTTYTWSVCVTDGITWTNETYEYTTGGNSGGDAPPPDGGGRALPSPPSNQPPIADAGEPYTGYVGEEITFNGSLSYDPDGGDIISWYWNFGDKTNGTGEVTNHTYSNPGVYNVTLTVTDDENAIGSTETTAIISQANRLPITPIINGMKTGSKNIEYTYTAVSTDPDNNTIRYLFDWDDDTNNTVSAFLASGTIYNVNHNWTTSGVYTVTVYAKDENDALSGTTEMTVFIDMNVRFIDDVIQGYLLDADNDGIYDIFHNNTTGNETTVELQDNGNYLIDNDGDTVWDYEYDPETSTLNAFASLEEEEKDITPWYALFALIVMTVITVIFFVYFIHRVKKEGKR